MIQIDDVPRPAPASGELLVRVAASGVGPWDAIIREGRSKVSPLPPLTLGSDFSGVVEEVGPDVAEFQPGDAVYGVTNPLFCGANAEYAVASAGMVTLKPPRLSHTDAASIPVVAVTAWQMLFEYADAKPGQTVLILGAGGNVGSYAVQLAAWRSLRVVALAGPKDIEYIWSLGADTVIDYSAGRFEAAAGPVDLVIDAVGGETRDRAVHTIKPGGVLVSVVSGGPMPSRREVRSVFFYVEVTTERLDRISELLAAGRLSPHVGTVLPLSDIRTAHEMLAGRPHERGKIVLKSGV